MHSDTDPEQRMESRKEAPGNARCRRAKSAFLKGTPKALTKEYIEKNQKCNKANTESSYFFVDCSSLET